MSQEDPVQIVFTSGKTADPKGVVITHRNVQANIEPLEAEIGKYLKYERIVHPLRFLNLLPLSHVFGQFLGIFIPQLFGATVVFHDSLNPSEVIHTIKQERVSVLVGVLTRALAQEVARFDIRVNPVAPGLVETEMTAQMPAAQRDRLLSSVPLGRMATPDEVAAVVKFLASVEASYITGQIIQVAGGI